MLAKARLQSGNIDMMRIVSALVGDRGGHTCRFSHAGADRHNADGGMREVVGGKATPCDQQIVAFLG